MAIIKTLVKYIYLNEKKKKLTLIFALFKFPICPLKPNRFRAFFNSCGVITEKLSNTWLYFDNPKCDFQIKCIRMKLDIAKHTPEPEYSLP